MWIFLAGDAMSFGGLLAAYGALRSASPNLAACPSHVLGIATDRLHDVPAHLQQRHHGEGAGGDPGRRQKRLRMFLGLTILGGITFLGMQAFEWTHLIHEGLALTAESVGRVAVRHHLLHDHRLSRLPRVRRRVLSEHAFWSRALRGKYSRDQLQRRSRPSGLYWHFVDLVWILVFTFVYLI